MERKQIEEMVRKYNIKDNGDGNLKVNFPSGYKPTDSEISTIKAAKPEILAYFAERKAEQEAIAAARRAEQEAIDKPLLDEMYAKAEKLRAQIPEGYVEVTVTKTGDSDGWPILEYEADGVKLRWDEVKMIGSACAIRPGALGAFAEIWIASIDRNRLEEIRARNQKDTEDKAAAKEAHRKELMETEIPQCAIEDYNRYKGDAEKAWEAQDEGAWAMIEKWAPYIEAQHGMHPTKAKKLAEEAAREANYGIYEG